MGGIVLRYKRYADLFTLVHLFLVLLTMRDNCFIPKSGAPLVPTSNVPFIPTSNEPFIATSNAPFIPRGNAPFIATSNAPFIPKSNAPFIPTTNAQFTPKADALFAPACDIRFVPTCNAQFYPTQNRQIPSMHHWALLGHQQLREVQFTASNILVEAFASGSLPCALPLAPHCFTLNPFVSKFHE